MRTEEPFHTGTYIASGDLQALLTAAGHDTPSVALPALCALVLLPLPDAAWADIEPLALRWLDRLVELDAAQRGEAVSAAGYVPLASIRARLRSLASGAHGSALEAGVNVAGRIHDGTVRLAAAYVLARAREQAALEPLLQLTGSGTPDARVAAAHGLGNLDVSTAVDRVRALTAGAPFAEVRLFTAMALAGTGDARSLVQAFDSLDRGDPPALYFGMGDPMGEAAELQALGPVPDPVRIALDAQVGHGRWSAWCDGLAASVVEMAATPDTGPSTPRAAAPAEDELRAHLVEADAALVHLLRESHALGEEPAAPAVFELFEALHQAAGPLRWVTPGDAGRLVQRVAEVAARAPGPGFELWNWIVGDFVPRLARGLRPDVAQLFETGREADPRQLAWLMSRAGLAEVVAALAPIVAEVEQAQRSARASRLIALAVTYQGDAFGPVLGGGSEPVAPQPPSTLITLPAAAPPDTAAAMPESSAAPPADAAPSPAAAAPPRYEDTLAGEGTGGFPPTGTGGADEDVAATVTRSDDARDDSGIPPPAGRFVQVMIRHRGALRRAFIAGEDHVLRCWIGPFESSDTRPRGVADSPVPPAPGEVELDVVLSWNGQERRGQLHLPRDPSARSDDCDLALTVPAGERFVSADLTFLYRNRVFEAVKVEAAVLDEAGQESERDRIDVKVQFRSREDIALGDRIAYDSNLVQTRDGLAVFGAAGQGRLTLQLDPVVDWFAQNLFATERRLVRRRAAAGAGSAPTLDIHDGETRALLIALARQGSALHAQLRQQAFQDPGERVQLVNLDPSRYVPLELVYDRGFPTDDAEIPSACVTALHRQPDAPHCPHCPPPQDLPAEVLDQNPVLCPFGFWSLGKIIERRDRLPEPEQDRVASPSDDRRTLAPITRMLSGFSDKVREADRDALRQTFAEHFTEPQRHEAVDWNDWRTTVASDYPGLLVVLPHHAVNGGLDTLEIAGTSLSMGQQLALYVHAGDTPEPPVMVLLGCESDRQGNLGYPSFARQFNAVGAAIVIGTLSKVLARHAAPVAGALTRELSAAGDGVTDMGSIMRRLRRRMFCEGYLMALALVALGDADWRIAPGDA